MKLSVEAKVAAAVAAGFIALTAAAIGQGGSEAQRNGFNNYDLADNPGVNTQMREKADDSSLSGRTNVEEDRQKLSEQDATDAASKRTTKSKTANLKTNQLGRHASRNQVTQTNAPK